MRLTPEITRIRQVAEALSELVGDVVFVGGSVVGLLVTDEAAPPARETTDVDVIVELTNRIEYYKIENRLRELGFQNPVPNGPICRWGHGELILDLMPTQEGIIGFSNEWYPSTVNHAIKTEVSEGLWIRLTDAPHFLATKLAAFKRRGIADPYVSHDLEDIVSPINGRAELAADLEDSPNSLRKYVAENMAGLMSTANFVEIIEGHLGAVDNTQGRLERVMSLLRKFARLS